MKRKGLDRKRRERRRLRREKLEKGAGGDRKSPKFQKPADGHLNSEYARVLEETGTSRLKLVKKLIFLQKGGRGKEAGGTYPAFGAVLNRLKEIKKLNFLTPEQGGHAGGRPIPAFIEPTAGEATT